VSANLRRVRVFCRRRWVHLRILGPRGGALASVALSEVDARTLASRLNAAAHFVEGQPPNPPLPPLTGPAVYLYDLRAWPSDEVE
jgi:hypothetical protein